MPTIRLHNIPNSTRVLVSCLIIIASLIFLIKLGHFRSATTDIKFHDIQVPYLQLIPRYTIFYPWVIVTSIFAETTIFSLIVSGTVLTVASKYIERFWGFREVIQFVFINGSITNLSTVLITIVSNIVRKDGVGMDRPLGGGISYYFGFLVVLKQLIPEHNIVLFQGLLNFRVKHLPFICLIIVFLWSIIISRSLYPVIPSFESFLVSYNYLRFYQSFTSDPLLPINNNETIIRGDASDAFKLVEFFPNITKPYLSIVFDKFYEGSVFLGIVTPFNDDSIEQGNIRASKRSEQINQTQKSLANSVAERRRQVALQVIEDRIRDSR
ncbi:transmembrane protein 115 homolog [[Candida] jaroonii]|uniref:Transmembrane protein 115 homolog n=1 Tax=[Candida] jaroonii TaxID=467808 RepID=A0ACA9YAX0_9ASCO|nr:transmembrane protein 115 homolog [[Candida] jaroonii]